MNKVDVDYEGMGTCISADIKIAGIKVGNISSSSPESNDIVSEIIEIVRQHLFKRRRIKIKKQLDEDYEELD